MNEEGSRFSPGMAGSEAYTGVKPLDVILDARDAAGVSVRDAVAEIHAGDRNVPLRPLGRPLHAFIEAHIEQADALQCAEKTIGIVSGIQGTRRYRVTVCGEAAHAGTALRRDRKDALMAAARMVCSIDATAQQPDDLKLTVGLFNVFPNAPSVVPDKVFFSIDVRHNDTAVVDRMDAMVRAAVEREKGPCAAAIEQIAMAPSLDFSDDLRDVLSSVAADLDLSRMDVYSAAGHDARQMHYFCPTAMIFIPCRDGISHNPNEWAEPAHVTAGAKLLADTLWRIAERT
jgi:N-carbamoyl-L-amino-acid hydrolase